MVEKIKTEILQISKNKLLTKKENKIFFENFQESYTHQAAEYKIIQQAINNIKDLISIS